MVSYIAATIVRELIRIEDLTESWLTTRTAPPATTDPQPATTDPQPTEVEQPHKPYNCSATSRTDQAIAASSFKKGTSLIIDDFNSEVSQFDKEMMEGGL